MSQRVLRSQKRSKPPSSSRLLSNLRLDSPPPAKKQRTKPLSSLARPPVFASTGSQPERPPQSEKNPKGKGKAAEVVVASVRGPDSDDRLWVDRYEPATKEDLAVHQRKVQDVRQWLLEAFDGGPSGKLKKYRRILALTGPAGTAKTTTLHVLARELNFEILEWRNSADERFARDARLSPGDNAMGQMEYEGLSEKFRAFLARASNCRTVFSNSGAQGPSLQSPSSLSQRSTSSSAEGFPASHDTDFSARSKRKVILLEDLPNILHPGTQDAFHTALEAFISHAPPDYVAPLVIIVSDAGLRGEDVDNDAGPWRRAKETIDIRLVLPHNLLNSPFTTHVRFNPVAPTLLRPALQRLLDKHFSSVRGFPPSKEVLGLIVSSSNGDIRSAVMALQFACVAGTSAASAVTKGSRKRGGGPNARVVMEAVTRREQSLALFHLLGKVLWNKRKGDPPAPSASAKDKLRDQELDARLRDPPPLPSHLKQHERRPSRMDVEMLYGDSPIDASLLSLYIHQNYTQYCNDLDECDMEADWLSWIDSSGGGEWHQANPHRFHLLALSTMHSLPSPVTRRSQKPYKPLFFDALQHEREAEDGVRDVQAWLQLNEEWQAEGWSRRNVALELGAILKVRDTAGVSLSTAPATHKLFSRLEFHEGSGGLEQLTEDGEVPQGMVLDESGGASASGGKRRAEAGRDEDNSGGGGWLESDDIEYF
ncbi:P-loop containing nucleoside triphosphate hydrolase protein [Laetiporus sulphureus 93-53]|uniref:p-loop containing nucleoside triphosphate hydrolase protein n=1 Tax=Laetiporus sulphureus 93-53 TaxID=1314785 RepID=A0A165CGK8_9APHY|nr:P-loop containing nucleoside triphosphate hydrolase protein [Laetiporus sulphureus 93-53]KZT02770.1 P-loop containing nucleoside triphosphate hydrolase protein [Laetiporus sulphureus 93-53]